MFWLKEGKKLNVPYQEETCTLCECKSHSLCPTTKGFNKKGGEKLSSVAKKNDRI